MADMDREMAMLGRAFGVPLPRVGMPPLASLFSDLPDWVAAPDLPAPAAIPLAVDARDAGDALHVTADVPGVPAEGLKVEVSGPERWWPGWESRRQRGLAGGRGALHGCGQASLFPRFFPFLTAPLSVPPPRRSCPPTAC